MQLLRDVVLELELPPLLGHANLHRGHLFGLIALRIRGRIANAFVVVERWHAGGQLAARAGNAGVRTVVDVGAAERFGDDGQWSAVDDDLSVWGWEEMWWLVEIWLRIMGGWHAPNVLHLIIAW